jgi:hypothetical protein
MDQLTLGYITLLIGARPQLTVIYSAGTNTPRALAAFPPLECPTPSQAPAFDAKKSLATYTNDDLRQTPHSRRRACQIIAVSRLQVDVSSLRFVWWIGARRPWWIMSRIYKLCGGGHLLSLLKAQTKSEKCQLSKKQLGKAFGDACALPTAFINLVAPV